MNTHARYRSRLLLALTLTGAIVTVRVDASRAQTTYTWVGGSSWQNPASWSPSRTVVATTDILVINGSTTPSAALTFSSSSAACGQLHFINGVVGTFSAPGNASLDVFGGTGTDFTVQAGSTLRFANSANGFVINVASSASGAVDGTVQAGSGTHRVNVFAVDGLTFGSGSLTTAQAGFSGTLLPIGPPNHAVFEAGATYVSASTLGLSPVATFEAGSLYKHQNVTTPQLAGQTYSHFEFNAAANLTTGGAAAFTADNFTVTAGTLHLKLITVNIRGDVHVAAGAALDFNPDSPAALTLDGTTSQTVTYDGALSLNPNVIVQIGNAAGVRLADPVTLMGNSTVSSGARLIAAAPILNLGSLHVNGTFQIDEGCNVAGNFFTYGASATLVFNNTSQLTHPNFHLAWPSATGPTHVVLQNGGGVDLLGNPRSVAGTLTLTDGILSGSATIYAEHVAGGSSASHVNGPLQKPIPASGTPSSHTFEIGDAEQYTPVSLVFPDVSTAGTLTVSTTFGDHPDIATSGLVASASVNRHWSIENSGTVFSPCEAVFTFVPGDVDVGADPTGFVVKKFDSPTWSAPVVGARTSTSIEANGIASFSEFQVAAPQWTEMIGSGLPGVYGGSAVWGDYDNDSDLDILLTGYNGSGFTRLIRNDNGNFVDGNVVLPGVHFSSAAWGDYDNDGDLDLLLTGNAGTGRISQLYQNVGGSFVDTGIALPGLQASSVAWADYDNDGDLDFLLTGFTGSAKLSRIYRNDAGSFVDSGVLLPGISAGSSAWGDYDGDGDVDLLVTGQGASGPLSLLYRNDDGNFVDSGVVLPGVIASSVAWGDYDGDADLDLLITGYNGVAMISAIYRNEAGTFVDTGAALPGVSSGSVAWGDYDNDGDLDLLLTGGDGPTTALARVYRNDAGSFMHSGAELRGIYNGTSATWSDYDTDGDLDLLLVGLTGTFAVASVYRNNVMTPNATPSAPNGLASAFSAGVLTLHWNAATDAETPAAGLTYNVRIGTTPDGDEVMAGMADATTGYRRVVALGNAGHRLSWSIELGPNPLPLYWSVQAIDAAFAGSRWGTEAVTSTDDAPRLPTMAALHQGRPNPFATTTQLAFDMPRAGQVTLGVFDVLGRRVRTLHRGSVAAGRHAVGWDGRDDHGRPVGAGVYWVHMEAGMAKAAQRITLLR